MTLLSDLTKCVDSISCMETITVAPPTKRRYNEKGYTRFHWKSVLRLPRGLADRLAQEACGRGISKNEVIIEALERHLPELSRIK